MRNIVAFRERVKHTFEARRGLQADYTPIIIEPPSRPWKEYPYVNASVDGETIILSTMVNMGYGPWRWKAASSCRSSKGADQMNLLALARAVQDLGLRARTKRLSPDDVHGFDLFHH